MFSDELVMIHELNVQSNLLILFKVAEEGKGEKRNIYIAATILIFETEYKVALDIYYFLFSSPTSFNFCLKLISQHIVLFCFVL